MLILGVIATPVYLLVGSSFAGYCTRLAQTWSPDSLANMGDNPSITWSTMECPDFRWAIVHAFSGEIVGIVVLVAWLALFVLLYKYMAKRNVEIKKELGH